MLYLPSRIALRGRGLRSAGAGWPGAGPRLGQERAAAVRGPWP